MLTVAPLGWFIEKRDGISREPVKEKVRLLVGIQARDATGQAALSIVPVILQNGQFVACVGSPVIIEEGCNA